MAVEIGRNGADWTQVPKPLPENSITRRTAIVSLDSQGNLSGEITISWEGQEALQYRLKLMDGDEAQRKEELRAALKHWLGIDVTLDLTSMDDWNAATDKFVVTAHVRISGYAIPTGKRMIVPVMVFSGSDDHPFTHDRRLHPVYFHVPYQEIDEIVMTVPKGMTVESVPPRDVSFSKPLGELVVTSKSGAGFFSITRKVNVNNFLIPVADYPELREFFDRVKSSGKEQVVLSTSK